jgi:hypothetical protein
MRLVEMVKEKHYESKPIIHSEMRNNKKKIVKHTSVVWGIYLMSASWEKGTLSILILARLFASIWLYLKPEDVRKNCVGHKNMYFIFLYNYG